MRRFAMIIGTAMPLLMATGAFAEDVVIRIEAKRGEAAAKTAAETWSASFPDVVTFNLTDGWVGIAIGPMPRETAEPRLATLKAEKKIPHDSFIADSAGRNLTAVAAGDVAGVVATTPSTTPEATDTGITAPTPEQGQAPETAAAATPPTGTPQDAGQAQALQPEAAPAEQAAVEAPGFYLRVQTVADRAKADEALAKWHDTLPEAGIWQVKNGRFAIGLGPIEEATARAWLSAFRNAEILSKDAFVATAEEMGTPVTPGTTPNLGAPASADAPAVEMPDLADIQRALRWEGHYDGAIDGKDGPKTQKSIAQEVAALRIHPEPARAMAALIARREAWRQEIGLGELRDEATGLTLPAPLDKLQFDRAERALSIYGPKGDSGAALILFSQPGGRQEMLDLTGLVTALGWVPAPERLISGNSAVLKGQNDTHIGYAEAHVVDGHAQGFVLIWPRADAENQNRIAIEIADSIARYAPAANEAQFAPAAATGAKSADTAAPAPTEAQAGQGTSP